MTRADKMQAGLSGLRGIDKKGNSESRNKTKNIYALV